MGGGEILPDGFVSGMDQLSYGIEPACRDMKGD
jgi:hypothetical protein